MASGDKNALRSDMSPFALFLEVEDQLLTSGAGRELGYAQITSDVVTSTQALTDIAGLTVTVTVAARPILVICQFDMVKCDAALLGSINLNADGSDVGSLIGAGNTFTPAHGARRLTPSAGSHTYKLRSSMGSAANPTGLTIKAGPGNAAGTNGPGFIQVVEI